VRAPFFHGRIKFRMDDPRPAEDYEIDRKRVTHLYAVLQWDRFQKTGHGEMPAVTIKEVHPTWEVAQAEVERLNALVKERGVDAAYWCEMTRWRADSRVLIPSRIIFCTKFPPTSVPLDGRTAVAASLLNHLSR